MSPVKKCLLLSLSAIFVFFLVTSSYSAQEKRIALVIGNGAYKSAPLRNPVNDATDIAIALEKTGFTVMRSVNATRTQMRRAIRGFGEEINKGAVGLFYYAGHGIQVAGENYLVPTGAEVGSEDEVEDECLKVSSVLRKMETAGNSLNIIILDACRDNPFARSFRSRSRGLAKMDAPTGSILAYATAPGSIAADGPGRNGLYTSALLKHMTTPGLEIGKLFRQVRIDVVGASGKKQVPWEASSLMGDFYFSAQRGIAVAPKQPVKEAPKYAAIPPGVTKPEIVARDGRYEKYANGIVKDTRSGLEWYAGPDKDTNWNDAKRWVASLDVDGGGWRMPTRKELKSLNKEGEGSRNMTSLLKTTGWHVWSGEIEEEDSSYAWTLDFDLGNGVWGNRTYSRNWRGFAVRSRR